MIVEKPGVNVALAQGLLDGGQVHIQTVILHDRWLGLSLVGHTPKTGIEVHRGTLAHTELTSLSFIAAGLHSEKGQSVLKWVEGSDVELLEVAFISGRNNQTVHPRGRGDHGVL